MIKVLVAEDEVPLLRGIKIMIERLNTDFSVVKCVHNGREAIDYLLEHSVDVIFTDINMPMQDGIALMEFAAEECPETEKIVISGYSDFTYAQQSIRYGARDYLLKPIEERELKRILCDLAQDYYRKSQERQKARLTDAVYTGKHTSQKEQVQIVYFCAGPFIREGMEETIAECNFWEDADIEKTACQLLPENTYVYSFEKNQSNENILLIVPEKEVELDDFSQKFVKEMQSLGIQVTAAYHPKIIEVCQIPAVSSKLRKRIQEYILFGEGSAICNAEGTKTAEPEYIFYFKGNEIRKTKEELVLKEAEAFLGSQSVRQKEVMNLLERLLKGMMEHAGLKEEQVSEQEEMIYNLILYSPGVEQLFTNLRQMLYEKKLCKKEETTEDFMRKVEDFIQKHMAEPITAKVLAAEFGLVAPYLSTLFKEYSGYTLSQYIQKIRLERAKNLLEMEGEILAKDVAEIVGYPNPLYFSKMFKKKIGTYPSEYRRNKRAEKRNEKEKGKSDDI